MAMQAGMEQNNPDRISGLLFTICSQFVGLSRILMNRVNLRWIEITGFFYQGLVLRSVFFAFTRQGSEVQNLARPPLEAKEIGMLLQRRASRFSFGDSFAHILRTTFL
jgi:hypothetical protein